MPDVRKFNDTGKVRDRFDIIDAVRRQPWAFYVLAPAGPRRSWHKIRGRTTLVGFIFWMALSVGCSRRPMPPDVVAFEEHEANCQDRCGEIPLKYLKPQYETELVARLRSQIMKSDPKYRIRRYRLIPPLAESGHELAQALCVDTNAAVRLRQGSIQRTIRLYGDVDPHFFEIEGTQFEIFRLEVHASEEHGLPGYIAFGLRTAMLPGVEQAKAVHRHLRAIAGQSKIIVEIEPRGKVSLNSGPDEQMRMFGWGRGWPKQYPIMLCDEDTNGVWCGERYDTWKHGPL